MLVMKSCFFCKISTPEFSGSIESSLYKMKSLNVFQINYKDNIRYLDLVGVFLESLWEFDLGTYIVFVSKKYLIRLCNSL